MPHNSRTATPGHDHVQHLADTLLALTPEQRTQLQPQLETRFNPFTLRLIERVVAERSNAGVRADPWTLARHLDGDTVKDWPYTRFLAQQFRKAYTGESPRQVWSLPAQVGKSTWLQRGVVWALDADPKRRYLYLPYGDGLAREASDFIRGQARDHADKLRFTLRHDRQAIGRWKTDEEGGLLATGLGGSVAGFGGSVIIDDPLKGWQEAHSPAARERAWNEIVAVGGFRMAEGEFMILAHTRWHLDDPTGRLMRFVEETGEPWEFVRLPMFAEDNDPIGRAPGDVLEPERYSAAAARSRALLAGTYLAQALEQQDPQPEQGGEFKREWWRWTASMPERYDQLISSWDMKMKDKESGDYVVGMVVGRIGARFWGLNMMRGQYSQLQTKLAIAVTHLRYQPSRHVIENTGNGPEVMTELRNGDPSFVLTAEQASKVGITDDEAPAVQQLMRRGVPSIVSHTPKERKYVRAQRISGTIEGGGFTLPEGKHWPAQFVDEWAAFPPKGRNGHDDIVDATSQAVSWMSNSQGSIVTPSSLGAGAVGRPAPGARATPARSRVLR